jgi:hypothetical protein
MKNISLGMIYECFKAFKLEPGVYNLCFLHFYHPDWAMVMHGRDVIKISINVIEEDPGGPDAMRVT